MSTPRIEHVNVTVSNPERAARLMEELFGWQVRWKGAARNGGHTIHVGSKEHYLALYTGRDVTCTADDFANYSAVPREPLVTRYRGHTIVGFPPPSSGGVHVSQALNILESFDLPELERQEPVLRQHVIAEALKRYGLLVADSGANWYITGTTDRRWDDDDLAQLEDIPGTAFEVVQSGPLERRP